MSMHQQKSRLTIECTLEEKTYIKMLATRAHMTISEFVLTYVRPDLPVKETKKTGKTKKPNKETLKAMQDVEEGKGVISCDSLDDFWKQMGVTPRAKK